MKTSVVAAVVILLTPCLLAAQSENRALPAAQQTGTNPQYNTGQGYFVFGLGAVTGNYYTPFVKQGGGGGELFALGGLAFGAEATYASWTYGNTAWIAAGDVSYHFGRNAKLGRIDPFVLGGPAGFFPTAVGEGRGAVASNVGAGVNWWLGQRSGLRFEIHDYIAPGSSNNGNFGPGPNYISFRIGVTFR